MSRQRLRPSLGESTHMACPRCSGMGTIRSVESMALALLRLIGEEARKERTTRVVAQLPVDVATFLINEKREWLHQLESQRETEIVLVPDSNMQTPNYSIRRVRDDEMALPENAMTSYQMAGQATVELDFKSQAEKRPAAAPAAVQQIAPAAPAPTPAPAVARQTSGPGLWSRLMRFLRGTDRPSKESAVSESGSVRRDDLHGGRHPRDHRDGRGSQRHNRGERGPRRDRDRDRNRNRDRDHDRDRDRNRPQDRDRNRPDDRTRADSPRDDAARHRERPAEPVPRPQPAAGQAPDQPVGDGESPRRRRRRRGRGGRGGREGRQDAPGAPQDNGNGNGDSRERMDVSPAPMPPPMMQPPRQDAPPAVPVSAAPPAPPASPAQQAPAESPAGQAPKPAQTHTVWSSTPGEGHHFGPKE